MGAGGEEGLIKIVEIREGTRTASLMSEGLEMIGSNEPFESGYN